MIKNQQEAADHKNESAFCFLHNRTMFLGKDFTSPHCKENKKTVDHLATRSERMLAFNYTRLHNEVIRCIHLWIRLSFHLKTSKKIMNHSVQEIISNKKVEIRVNTSINTDVKIQYNKPDIFILDKVKKEITLIEVDITCQNIFHTVESNKLRKYDLLSREIGLKYKCRTRIIPYVLKWDGIVTT